MSAQAALPIRALIAYAALGLPLAFAALPIYVHVPKLYGDSLGLSLALVGAVLLGTRLFDALIDPLLGVWSDRRASRRALIALSCPLMLGGMFALLNPDAPAWRSQADGALWLGASLAAVYVGYSLATINYYAWGAEISRLPHERTRITAAREGFALIGVILAAALPGLLAPDFPRGLSRLSIVFAGVLAVAACVTLSAAPRGAVSSLPHPGVIAMLATVARDRRFLRLLLVFAINGIASAIPATLVLFFVGDVLHLAARADLFLVLYFVGGAVALPLWVGLSRRFGKAPTWCAAMVLAMAVFCWAGTLGAGDFWQFAVICAASGIALGADLALPPSILADVLDRGDASARSGAYFGVWNFVTKLNLALAAGITLPLLQWAGYTPGQAAGGAQPLILAYAFAPLLLKTLAVALLWRHRHAFIPEGT